MKKALIVGCNGQDGRLLNEHLLRADYAVSGIDKHVMKGISPSRFCAVDILSEQEVFQLLKESKPDEIYYLPAYHQSSETEFIDNIELFGRSFDVHVRGLLNFLEGIKRHSISTRIFYAASSHIFGNPETPMQTESTPINPRCVYGITKAAGLSFCRMFRENHSIFASVGILYNHESALRGNEFISKKIITSAAGIKKGTKDILILGDLSAEIDWGYAPDYVDAMHRILSCAAAGDFIVATGEKHTVRDFVETAFEYLGLDWKKYVKEDRSIIRKKNYCRIGDPGKLMTRTGWKPSVDFKGMIKRLLEEQGVFT